MNTRDQILALEDSIARAQRAQRRAKGFNKTAIAVEIATLTRLKDELEEAQRMAVLLDAFKS